MNRGGGAYGREWHRRAGRKEGEKWWNLPLIWDHENEEPVIVEATSEGET